MAWLPMSQFAPQFVDSNGDPYSGAVLKAYQDGTSTNTNMATDSTGGTTFTSVALNADGYPEVSGSVVIPHIDQDYKIALYATQAAADADSGALWEIDNVPVDSFFLDVAREYTKAQNFNETSLTSTSASVAWDCEANQVATHTLTENTTIAAPTNHNAGGFYSLKIVQHASSAKTVAYNTVFKFPGSVTPTMSTGVNDVDIMSFRSDGTNLHLVGIVQDSS